MISPGLRAAVEYLAAAETPQDKQEAQEFFDAVSETDPLGAITLTSMYLKWANR